MIPVKRRGAARLAAVVLASGLAAAGAIATAGPAAADDASSEHGGASATLGGLKIFDKAVLHDGHKSQKLDAGLFEMHVDGNGEIQTYCIDVHNPTQTQAKYKEVDWSASSLHDNDDAGKILWILENSYPKVTDLTSLAQKAGAGNLSPQTAAAGTQVAIWRFSDHVKVDAVNKDAEKLADYLEDKATNLEEPKASLKLDPSAVSGKAGEKVGPVTVHSDAEKVTVKPDDSATSAGVKVVDKSGQPLSSATDGTELYFDVPAGAKDGSASLTAQATTPVPVGRAFTSPTKSQTQILAGSKDSNVTAPASVTWAKQGAIPAVSAQVNCAKNGVDVTATNKGDEAFSFKLSGEEHSVEAGKSETITVPVKEDQAYKFTITGPNGFEKTFSGVLDCQTQGGGGSDDQPSSKPSPATAGGSTGGDSDDKGGDLAETGSSSATPMIAGIAGALVVVGGGTVFLLRKKKATS